LDNWAAAAFRSRKLGSNFRDGPVCLDGRLPQLPPAPDVAFYLIEILEEKSAARDILLSRT
jgi:hypothetical protein